MSSNRRPVSIHPRLLVYGLWLGPMKSLSPAEMWCWMTLCCECAAFGEAIEWEQVDGVRSATKASLPGDDPLVLMLMSTHRPVMDRLVTIGIVSTHEGGGVKVILMSRAVMSSPDLGTGPLIPDRLPHEPGDGSFEIPAGM